MELLRGLAGSDLVLRLGWALVHSLWQGLAVAMLLAVVLRMLSRRSPAARYLAACAAMVLMLAGLAVTPWVLAPSAVDRPAARAAWTPWAVSAMPVPAAPAEVDGQPDMIPPSSDLPAGYGTGGEGKAAPIAPAPGLLQRVGRVLQPALPWTVAAWLAGVAVIGIYQLTGYLAAQRLRRLAVRPAERTLETVVSELARRLRLSRPVRVLESALIRVPTVVGWLWPAILLPVGFATGLSPHQVRAILLHELAHIRRYDYLVNLLQTLAETLLFYHPAVWWVSARVRAERENCCDDAALAAGGEPVSYAESLLALAQRAADDRRLGSPGRARAMAAATGVYAAGRPSQLRLRVARLLGARPHRAPRTWPVALLVLAAGLGILVCCPDFLAAMGRPQGQRKSDPTATALRYEVSIKDSARHPAEEGIVLTVRLTNSGQQTVAVPWGRIAYDDMFRFRISGPDGRELVGPGNRLMPPLARSQAEYKDLPPGGMLNYDIYLGRPGRNGQRWYFRKAGTYKLSAQYTSTWDSYIDAQTHQPVKVANAWTGSLQGQPVKFDYELPKRPDELPVTPNSPPRRRELEAPSDFGGVSVSGKVLDPQGKPMAGAVVTVFAMRPQREGVGMERADTLDRQVSGPDGGFRFDSLPDDPLAFSVQADHSPFARAKERLAHQPPAKAYQTTLRMQPGVDVAGTVTDEQGRPLEGVRVQSYATNKTVYTGADGRFAISGLTPDRLDLDFWRADYGRPTTSVAPSGGANQGDWTVVLKPSGPDSPASAPATQVGMRGRRFVRLVVGKDRMTLEGKDVTMESLPTALEAVPDRPQTVLEFAVTGDDVPASRVVEATALAVAAAREYGFEYFSDTGTHPLGTMGDATKTLGVSQVWTEGPIAFDAPLAVNLKLLHPPMPGYRGSEPFEVLFAQRLTFTRQGNQVQGGLAARLTSYPKATYVVTLELLDAAGKVLAGKKAQLEASGEAIGQALRFQEHLIFPLGAADKLASATTWRLTLSIVSSDGIPTTTSAPAGVAEAAQEFLSLLQAEQWDQAGGLMAGVADAAQQIALLRRVSPELGIVSMYADPSEGLAVTGPIKDEPAREGAFLIHLQNSSAGWRVAEVRHVGSVAAQLRIESFLGSHPDARSEAVKEVSHNPFTAPDTKALVRPQEAMDLDAARGDEVAPWPAAFDVAWTGDEWVLNPDSQARVMTIDGVEDFAGAAAKAIGMIKPLMTSRQRELAGPARFAAVLTSQGNLAIIEAAPAEGKAPYGSLNWALGRIVPEGDRYRVVKFDGFRRQFRQTQLDQPAPDRTTAHPAGTSATQPAAATPLHQAAAGGHVQTVQELVRAGADPNARDAAGQTPLHLAAAGGHGQTAEALIRLGSDPTARDAAGQTPLHLAAAGGHGQTAEALIRLGSDPAARDAAGQTPLDLAAAGGHGQTSQALATAGANPASQSAGPTGQVSAAALVREVRAQEQWIEQANSFHARVESRWTRNPDLVAQERAKLEAQDTQVPVDERNNPNLRPEYTTTDELAFDRQRIIQISSDPGVCDRWRVWNGRECIELSKPSTSDRAMVVLANKTELGRWFEHFWLTLSWLRAGPHTFWWTSERPEGQEQLFGQPEEYVLIGQEPFRGRECYVLDCAATFRTLYVGVDDHRLHGLTRHALESWTHPEIERVLMELAAQHGASLTSPQEYDQWLHRQPLELQHAISKEYSVRLRPVAKPQATHWLDDYRQVAPGCYLPMDQGYTIFRHTGPDQMVEDVRRQMKVTRIRVNEPLEDSLFDVRIPDGAQVEDRRQPEDAF